ncbi:hypothetical protein [Methylobacterium sp. J-070]|uniref:hypothetical protein n=1 Tax=Methylobacterium sp. J-070 TaxID=2836650 RepID=UPI001FB89982|nr:hypothetical protein [Methylobacterium sp. J-070]MCJ2050249.1 hypothetical protein [Methylobacterium sp. J-070]
MAGRVSDEAAEGRTGGGMPEPTGRAGDRPEDPDRGARRDGSPPGGADSGTAESEKAAREIAAGDVADDLADFA